MVPTMGTIGERIRDRRKALKLRQGDLAELIGVDQSTVSDIERGKGFGADVLMRLSKALGVEPEFVMTGDEGSIGEIDDNVSTQKRAVKSEVDESSTDELGSVVADNESSLCQAIPTSMPISAPNLKSAVLLMGSLVGALDMRRRSLVLTLLKDLVDKVDDPEEVADIAEAAYDLALKNKAVTKNKALDKALRGRKDPVETKPAKLEH